MVSVPLSASDLSFTVLSWSDRVVLQKLSGEHDGRDPPFLLSLGRHSKQAGDEGDLPMDVSLVLLQKDGRSGNCSVKEDLQHKIYLQIQEK